MKQVLSICRSSHPEVFLKSVVENFSRFLGKHLCQGLFLNKVAGHRRPSILLKKTLSHVFSCEFCEIFKNTFFDRTPPLAGSEYHHSIIFSSFLKPRSSSQINCKKFFK